jgi:hypothetical protein
MEKERFRCNIWVSFGLERRSASGERSYVFTISCLCLFWTICFALPFLSFCFLRTRYLKLDIFCSTHYPDHFFIQIDRCREQMI